MGWKRIALALVVFVSACTLDRSGTGPAPFDFIAEPNLICAGDDVSLAWDIAGLNRDRAFCSAPDGGYASRTSCSADSECASGGRCYDGLCVRPGVDLRDVDFGDGCVEPTTITITASPGRGGIPVSAAPRDSGSVTVNPLVDTAYSGIVTTPRGTRPARTRNVAIVPAEFSGPPLERTVSFGSPACNAPGTPLTVDFEKIVPDPVIGSSRVSIRSVQNSSGYPVTVLTNDPVRGPVALEAGEATMALNGVTGRIWSVAPIIDPGDGPAVPGANDCSVAGTTQLPPAVLTLSLTCRP